MEPVDGGQVGGEPVVGWRVWRLDGNRLVSFALEASWEPGENQARCHAGRAHDVPAPGCHCGFWAVNDPISSMYRTISLSLQHSPFAVGLIRGYGTIALHGNEGFRAALASVVCIFSDAPESIATDERRTAADRYGVPCLTLESAISIGFLQEVGVERAAVARLEAWIAGGRPLPQPPKPPQPPGPGATPIALRRDAGRGTLTGREWQVARLVARGLTTKQIARSLCVNSRAVDYHLYRLIEKTNSANRAELARWVMKHGAA